MTWNAKWSQQHEMNKSKQNRINAATEQTPTNLVTALTVFAQYVTLIVRHASDACGQYMCILKVCRHFMKTTQSHPISTFKVQRPFEIIEICTGHGVCLQLLRHAVFNVWGRVGLKAGPKHYLLISSLWRGTFLIGTLLEHSFIYNLYQINAISFQMTIFHSKKTCSFMFFKFF